MPGPKGPTGPPGPPGPVIPARTICVQLPTLFSTQTTTASDTSQLVFINITPPGTYVAPYAVQSIAVPRAISYPILSFTVTPPSVPGGPSGIAINIEVPVEIRATDANGTSFTITGRVFVPIGFSMMLPPNFILRDLQALVTLSDASAVITSLTEITLSAVYTFCFNAFQTEMVSLQAGLTACACNGVPLVLGGP